MCVLNVFTCVTKGELKKENDPLIQTTSVTYIITKTFGTPNLKRVLPKRLSFS